VPRERAFADVAQFDPWSRHIIEHLFGGPAFRPDAQGFLPLEIEAKHS
jgi:hypothetical protein